jgi:hypothetical protein
MTLDQPSDYMATNASKAVDTAMRDARGQQVGATTAGTLIDGQAGAQAADRAARGGPVTRTPDGAARPASSAGARRPS